MFARKIGTEFQHAKSVHLIILTHVREELSSKRRKCDNFRETFRCPLYSLTKSQPYMNLITWRNRP